MAPAYGSTEQVEEAVPAVETAAEAPSRRRPILVAVVATLAVCGVALRASPSATATLRATFAAQTFSPTPAPPTMSPSLSTIPSAAPTFPSPLSRCGTGPPYAESCTQPTSAPTKTFAPTGTPTPEPTVCKYSKKHPDNCMGEEELAEWKAERKAAKEATAKKQSS